MKSRWLNEEAEAFANDPLALRVYTSRLLGREPSLVQHGGGNTSVKITQANIFGDNEDILFVKGSGWDLASIEKQGFAPVKMKTLLRLAHLEQLSDKDMVREQKAAMTLPSAPAPSVEAILHAIIPFKFVDHTHSDAIVTITNTPDGEKKIREIFGDSVIYVPYVMPGFILARKIFELTRDISWDRYQGMILLNHGVFTFSDNAKTSYERMIELVATAETYLQKNAPETSSHSPPPVLDQGAALTLSSLRKKLSQQYGSPLLATLNSSPEALSFSTRKDLNAVATRGTITPDHVIHIKPWPLVLKSETNGENLQGQLQEFKEKYLNYFERNKSAQHICLDQVPRWSIWPKHGTLAIAPTTKQIGIINDLTRHTLKCIDWGEKLGGWTPLPEKDLFEVEYWELEQAKLKVKGAPKGRFQGKSAVVTGAASGIGRACVEQLLLEGASVTGLDIDPQVSEQFPKYGTQYVGRICDVTNSDEIQTTLQEAVFRYGGIDVLVSNAGSFPPGKKIEELPLSEWSKSIELNLTSHFKVLQSAIPFLKNGIDPNVIIMASKNVPAPGPGASAYSCAKAALTQLSRVAALELAEFGIRVNVVHPDAVFDTSIWTADVLANRAKHYGLSVEQYKRKNLLKTEIKSDDVALLVLNLASPMFAKTTGAQISIDGGNDRVI